MYPDCNRCFARRTSLADCQRYTAVKAFAADRIFKIKWDSNGTIQNEYGAPLNGQVVALACVNSGCYAVIR